LKHAPAPPRSYSQRLGFFEGTSPRGLPCRFTLLRSASTELSFSCCGSIAAPRAEALAPWSSTCGAQRAAPRETAWAAWPSLCDAQRAAPRAAAWAPQSSTC